MYRQSYRQNKFNAKRTKYNGRVYHSKFEASIAQEMDLRKKAKDIKDWEPQFKVEIWAYNKDGDPVIKKTHRVDFRIEHNDGSYELVEAKGVETPAYKETKRWLEKLWLPENPDHTYTVVRQRQNRGMR